MCCRSGGPAASAGRCTTRCSRASAWTAATAATSGCSSTTTARAASTSGWAGPRTAPRESWNTRRSRSTSATRSRSRLDSMKRARFAPSPTGSLHVGNALSAVANRSLADWLLLRIDDTDPARNVPGGEEALLRDLEWLGLAWDEGPARQSERRDRHLEVGAPLGERFEGVTLVREDGSPTYHLASVVDDADFAITHVVRGNDHRPNEELHRRLHAALGTEAPEYVHHGLILGPDGKKMSKRAEGATV